MAERMMDMRRMDVLTDRLRPEPQEDYYAEFLRILNDAERGILPSLSSSDEEEEEEKPKVYNAPRLYIICLVRALDLLKTKEWKESGKNLQSLLTKDIIRELWLSAFRVSSVSGYAEASVKDSIQTVTKDGLQLIDMTGMETDKQDLILTMLTADSCKNLRTLLFPGTTFFTTNDAIDAVVRLSPNLEEIHYPDFFELNAFENCSKIRRIRFHRLKKTGEAYFLNKDSKFPESLKNLEVFAFCGLYKSAITVPTIISKILEMSPKVVSVGCTDSSGALELIQKKNVDSPRYFQLRRCYWSKEYHELGGSSSPVSESRQFHVIQTAVKLCPLVEKLIIKVSDPSCLAHLKQLKHLSSLYVGFYRQSDENIIELISLFKIIGPQLKHLRIEDKGEVPVDGILECCSNLQSLHIQGTMEVPESFKTFVDSVPLQRLHVTNTNESSLLTLLTKCRRLKELTLERVPWLDDVQLSNIIRQNLLSKLEVFMVYTHDLSERSFRKLLEATIYLKHIGGNGEMEYYVRCSARDWGLQVKSHKYFEYVGYNDFFSKLFNKCHF